MGLFEALLVSLFVSFVFPNYTRVFAFLYTRNKRCFLNLLFFRLFFNILFWVRFLVWLVRKSGNRKGKTIVSLSITKHGFRLLASAGLDEPSTLSSFVHITVIYIYFLINITVIFLLSQTCPLFSTHMTYRFTLFHFPRLPIGPQTPFQ